MSALPISGKTYFIVPACAPDLSVGAFEVAEPGFGGTQYRWKAVLQPMAKRSPAQQWIVYVNGHNAQFRSADYIRHRGWGLVHLSLGRTGDDSRLSTVDPTAPDPNYGWNLIPQGDWYCLQSFANYKQNMNVLGDGPYPENTEILTYTWSGGAPNEIWKFIPFD